MKNLRYFFLIPFLCGFFYLSGQQMDVRVYPNPAQNEITLSTNHDLMVVSIYNIERQKIIEEYPHFRTVAIDISQLPDGVYIIRAINCYDKTYTQQFVVEK